MSFEIIPKGWGHERIIVNNDKYCGKVLVFEKGKSCSYHFHKTKDETFYLQSGRILLRYSRDDDITMAVEVVLQPGDSFHVPTGMRHQMTALEPSELFEFSTTDHPDDSIRIIKGD